MPPDRRVASGIVSSRWGTLGDAASAALVIAAASGVVLAVPYDARDAYGSIAAILLANPAAAFFRNLHYWAGQLCLVLTLLHVWDHWRARTEHHVGRGVWLRLVITVPLLGFIMLSGFMLRGDAEGQQALRIVTEATAQVPAVGPLLATLIFGSPERLDVVYIQHAATATIAVWLFVIEHVRRVWPRPAAFLLVALVTCAVSLVLSPGLHDGLEPIVKGPWYFLGLQEILHWTAWPIVVVVAGAGIVAAAFAVRVVSPRRAARTKAGLLALAAVYAGLCGVGAFLRGENWAWAPAWPAGAGNVRAGLVFGPTPDAPARLPAPLPVVMGRSEGCLVCHAGVTGLGDAHRPEAIGCASCHGGDVFTLDKARAHDGMETTPGNLARAGRGCGQAACHPAIIPRVERSVMTTMSGIVEVDRAVFGESQRQPASSPAHVLRLGRTAADTHLRQLCASCHLGATKQTLGPNGEDSRGGGCNACHLHYGPPALDALVRYELQKGGKKAVAPTVHPALSLDLDNRQCFGCHSRSGRISTSYEGWHEVHEPPAEASDEYRPAPSRFRVLEDGRVFERVTPDVHQERGLDCVDCHSSLEVMGDGVAHARKSGQLRFVCEDCHAPAGSSLPRVPAAQLDPESRRILTVRKWQGQAASYYVRSSSGDPMVNVVIDPAGQPRMARKRTGERLEVRPTALVCVEGRGHARLSCGSCHTAWAPRCPACHTAFDPVAEAYDWLDDDSVRGGWKEEAGPFFADLPTLGVRRAEVRAGARREVIDTFVPGMVLTVDRSRESARGRDTSFRRLFARIEPHTTRREARSCESCHSDPVAIGYGRGELTYERAASGGRWRFAPASRRLPSDGLPADAWVPFLGTRGGMLSTREDVRPFTVEEQRRILRVGACLTCHPGTSPVMRGSVRDFEALLARRSARCLVPAWD